MKKLLFILLSTLLLANCSKGNEDNNDVDTDTSLVGHWQLETESVEMTTSSEGETYDHWKGNYETFRVEKGTGEYGLDKLIFSNPKIKQHLFFHKNGNLETTLPNKNNLFVFTWFPEKGNYKINGNQLYVYYKDKVEDENGKWHEEDGMDIFNIDLSLLPNKLSLTYEQPMIKVKQVFKKMK